MAFYCKGVLLYVVLLLQTTKISAQAENITRADKQILNIYLIPGQGSDKRIFSKLELSDNYRLQYLNWIMPSEEDNMKSFAEKMAQQIDTTENFALIGVSLGGMVAVELTAILSPALTIIVSSAKNRGELPFRYRFQKFIPIYKKVPPYIYGLGSQIMQPLVEPDRKKQKAIFKAMLKDKDPAFLKRTTRIIMQWDRNETDQKIFHIHGDNDHTIPIRNVVDPIRMDGSSHMMILTEAEKLNSIIREILSSSNIY